MQIKKDIIAIVLDYLNTEGKEKNQQFAEKDITFNITSSDFEGDYTIVLFPFIKRLGKKPDELAAGIAEKLAKELPFYSDHNLVKGFLNISLTPAFWKTILNEISSTANFGFAPKGSANEAVLFEFPSPNTNKPLHLGHLRNIFLGQSLGRILEANGYKSIITCLYNDRGTNISKSMWSYLHEDDKLTPELAQTKGDKLVGDYYVKFSNEYKQEIKALKEQGLSDEDAKKQSKLDKEIADLTIKWENNDEDVRSLWNTMNGWFYDGVKQTFERLNLSFDQEYYESKVYDKGRETVKEGLEKGVFYQKDDTSVWVDLTDIKLDQKLVLRSNGTTVYMTQDIALAYQKQEEFDFQRSIYVVGNEQDYHFKVLFEILKRLGLRASEHLYHLSYGMVELPTGKMKSREGTVVDADDILDEVISIAREKADEQGKLAEVDESQREFIYNHIGLGALRYFILKVDPVKRMVYNPAESIDFNGNTAPFIQYIHARTCSLQRNAEAHNIGFKEIEHIETYTPNATECKLTRTLLEFPNVVNEAGKNYSPALVANYAYQVASEFSSFYHDYKILKEEDEGARSFRFHLSQNVRSVIKDALGLLCIEAPERM